MIQKCEVNFTPANEMRTLHIYLPDDYETSGEHYPVMYFFDGHNLFFNEDATYGKSWGLKEFMDSWEKKLIIVGVTCSMTDRLVEYCPYHFTKGFLGEIVGTGDTTIRWMLEELKPVIDRDYRTIPFRECTAIGGSSMGGIMALYAGIHYNQWISKTACISTAMGFCMPALMKDLKESYIDPDTRIYLSWGTKEAYGIENIWQEDISSITYRNHKKVHDKLWEKGANARMDCQVGGGHCEADWEKLVPFFMNYLWRE